jgi:hypothetical protein
MKALLVFFFLAAPALVFSQKAEYLLDENGKAISENAFRDRLADKKYTVHAAENDTALIAKLVLRESTGKITQGQRSELRKKLETITGQKIDSAQTIVAHFFYENKRQVNLSSCIGHYTTDNSYQKFFRKNTAYQQFFFTQKGYNYGKNTFQDTEDALQSLFFQDIFYCGNYVILWPDGTFVKGVGEHRLDRITEILDSKK